MNYDWNLLIINIENDFILYFELIKIIIFFIYNGYFLIWLLLI